MSFIACEPTTVAEEFVTRTLRDPAYGVLTLVGEESLIRPHFAEGDEPKGSLYVAHGMAPGADGAATLTLPLGKPPAMFTYRWQLIGWRKGQGKRELAQLMTEVAKALLGPTMSGGRFTFVDSDTIAWAISVLYGGSANVSPTVTPTGVWSSVSFYATVFMRQKG